MSPVKRKVKKTAAKKVKAPVKKAAKKAIKKAKSIPKKKVIKKAISKKAVKRSPIKTKKTVAKRVKAPVTKKSLRTKKVAKKVAIKKVVSPVKKIVLKKRETKRPRRGKEKIPAFSSTTEIKTHGEDLHFIPTHDNVQPPITTLQVPTENMLHHKDDVAFKQENKKVQASIIAGKNIKRVQRRRGMGRMK